MHTVQSGKGSHFGMSSIESAISTQFSRYNPADTIQEMLHYNRFMHLRGINSASRYIPGEASL